MSDTESPVPANDQPSLASTSAGGPAETKVGTPASIRPGANEAHDFDEYEELTPEIAEDEAIRNDFVIRWAVVLLAFLLGSTRIADTTTLVHVKTGEYLASHGLLPPRTDVFSYTASDRPWANLSWGFDLFVAAVHAVGGFVGLSAVKAILIALAFWVISRISRPGTPTWWGSVCGALALLGCHLRMPATPVIVTYLGLALTAWLIYSWRESTDKPKRVMLLVPLFFVWCNCDSRAWLGLAFIVLYALGDALGAWLKSPVALAASARQQLWKAVGGSIAVTLVHPFWWKSLAAPWFLYTAEYPGIRDYILEKVIDPNRTNVGGNFTYFPLTQEGLWTWTHLNLGILATFALVAF
ncbi:MAG: hypothetical protein JSS02_05295, partial [Planctomycetes bacterium]|nr:hypothetical protein [Planctomycetota bacterium]